MIRVNFCVRCEVCFKAPPSLPFSFSFLYQIVPEPFVEKDIFSLKLLFHLFPKGVEHIWVDQFLVSLFCSIDQYGYPPISTTIHNITINEVSKSSNVISPTWFFSFFFFIILAILVTWAFHINFGISLSVSTKIFTRFDRNCIQHRSIWDVLTFLLCGIFQSMNIVCFSIEGILKKFILQEFFRFQLCIRRHPVHGLLDLYLKVQIF